MYDEEGVPIETTVVSLKTTFWDAIFSLQTQRTPGRTGVTMALKLNYTTS